MEFLIRHDGRELGPYSEEEIRKRLALATFNLSDSAKANNADEWAPLSSLAPFATADSAPPLHQQSWGAYTAATFQPDERPLHQTQIHWIALSGSVIGAFLCLVVIVPIAIFAAWRDFYWAWFLLVIPFGIVASAAVTVKTSELVITDRRVLIK